ncbi:MAG: hypothetical protein OSJ62_03290 [Lachnospiraceae bacterium]|nr:hypothetical protein [Lachnospiraceae bacterium]
MAASAQTTNKKGENLPNLLDADENYIFCYAAQKTILEKLKRSNIVLSQYFNVQQAKTIIYLVSQKNGIGILSEVTLDSSITPKLSYYWFLAKITD